MDSRSRLPTESAFESVVAAAWSIPWLKKAFAAHNKERKEIGRSVVHVVQISKNSNK